MANFFRMNVPGCTYLNIDRVECLDIRLDGVLTEVVIIPRISGKPYGCINLGPGTIENFETMATDWLKSNFKMTI